ncbi:zinc metallopeptidase [Aureisphaera sp. CAU 1614]|uniref:Zinc metallopeptidase n=1 Tax=Halomarinibacterium sedimenti TaxID=2857106 RepID=A0A9X1FN89_9FLAO|nr:zinc metallopeptidase [Halomarinibacterium sedimenti]MBW2937004.1 zinc metallopeptidase [Halomarinibacterium sedimenti]
MMGYYIIAGLIFLVSMYVSNRLKSKFKKYSQVHLQNGMSGKEIAEKMLADNGITDVQVISTPGMLTDHYNPANKTVNLSEGVYLQRNAAAAAVAAHEVGHAVQHANAYSWLAMRSAIVPVVGVASKLSNFVIMAGLVMTAMNFMGALGDTVFLIGIMLFAATTAFAFITLPVEYDASSRALAWLQTNNMVTQQEYAGSKDALKWAARTYVVAALGSLATLLYFISVFLGRD